MWYVIETMDDRQTKRNNHATYSKHSFLCYFILFLHLIEIKFDNYHFETMINYYVE